MAYAYLLFLFSQYLGIILLLRSIDERLLENLDNNIGLGLDDGIQSITNILSELVVCEDVVSRQQVGLLSETLDTVNDFSCKTFLLELLVKLGVQQNQNILVAVGLIRGSF